MYMVRALRVAVVWYQSSLPMSFRVTPLSLVQCYDHPSNGTQQNKASKILYMGEVTN